MFASNIVHSLVGLLAVSTCIGRYFNPIFVTYIHYIRPCPVKVTKMDQILLVHLIKHSTIQFFNENWHFATRNSTSCLIQIPTRLISDWPLAGVDRGRRTPSLVARLNAPLLDKQHCRNTVVCLSVYAMEIRHRHRISVRFTIIPRIAANVCATDYIRSRQQARVQTAKGAQRHL